MSLSQWLADGSIKSFRPQENQIKDLLASADSDIEAAAQLLESGHYGVGRDTAYEAMLKSGMALMFDRGYRPESGGHHVTVVGFTEEELGPEHEALIQAFDRLRRSRHQRLYQGKEAATKSGAQTAIKNAKLLKTVIADSIG